MQLGRERITCSVCNAKIDGFKYESMPEWKISGFLCNKCYSKKLSDYYLRKQSDSKG